LEGTLLKKEIICELIELLFREIPAQMEQVLKSSSSSFGVKPSNVQIFFECRFSSVEILRKLKTLHLILKYTSAPFYRGNDA
jgi:hypothetical protein